MFSVTLQQKQQKTNTTMYSKQKLSFIPNHSKANKVLSYYLNTLWKHFHIYKKEKQEKQCQ